MPGININIDLTRQRRLKQELDLGEKTRATFKDSDPKLYEATEGMTQKQIADVISTQKNLAERRAYMGVGPGQGPEPSGTNTVPPNLVPPEETTPEKRFTLSAESKGPATPTPTDVDQRVGKIKSVTKKKGPFGSEVYEFPPSEAEKQADIEGRVQKEVQSATGKEAAKMDVTSEQIQAMARQTFSQLKGMYKQQGGSGIGSALFGIYGAFRERLTGDEDSKHSLVTAYEGMRNDMATRLGRIYGGSGRIAARIIEMAKQSLPTRWDTMQHAADKLAQTVWNSENLARAAAKKPLLTDEEKKEIAESIAAQPAAEPITVKNVPKGVKYKGPGKKSYKSLWE